MTRYVIVAVVLAVIFAAVLIYLADSCGLRHIWIVSDLEEYDRTLDPMLCSAILERIYEFNEECKPPMEILDCG